MGGVGTGFERAGCGGSECNEGGDGEKGREADEHLLVLRVGEFDCSRCDGMLFADGELFYNLPFYTERRTSFPSLCAPLRTACSPNTHVGGKRSGVPTCHSVTAKQRGEKQNKYVVKLTRVVAGWECQMTTAHWCLDQREYIAYGGWQDSGGKCDEIIVRHIELVTYQCLSERMLKTWMQGT